MNASHSAGGPTTAYRSPLLSQTLLIAVPAVAAVLQGESLSSSLKRALELTAAAGSNALTQAETAAVMGAAVRDLCYNTLRDYGVVDVLTDRLARGDLEPVVRALIYCALGELIRRPTTAHAVVDQAVQAAVLLRRVRAKGLVNAVLRQFLRQKQNLLLQLHQTDSGRYHHPQWWVDHLRQSHPDDWQHILAEAEVHPPMTLRVNQRRGNVVRSLERMKQAGIAVRDPSSQPPSDCPSLPILLERALPVTRLPGFAEGEVSVQDAGAQLAAYLLDTQPGMRVLDACAAPGGKAAHVLELVDCQLLAMDVWDCRRSLSWVTRPIPRHRSCQRECSLIAYWRTSHVPPVVWCADTRTYGGCDVLETSPGLLRNKRVCWRLCGRDW